MSKRNMEHGKTRIIQYYMTTEDKLHFDELKANYKRILGQTMTTDKLLILALLDAIQYRTEKKESSTESESK